MADVQEQERREHEAERGKIEDLENELAELQKKLTRAENGRKREKAKLKPLEQEVADALEERDEAMQKLKSLEQSYTSGEAERLRHERDEAHDDMLHLRADLKRVIEERDQFREEAEQLRSNLMLAEAAPKAKDTRPPSPAPLAPEARRNVAARSPASVPTVIASPLRAVMAVYIAWCREEKGLIGRASHFQMRLAELVPGAKVQRTSRDADSPIHPVQLKAGGVSPVEYWVISHEGAHVLVPQPISPAQFRELSPCFRGSATPATLKTIEPAKLSPSGQGYEISTPGNVTM